MEAVSIQQALQLRETTNLSYEQIARKTKFTAKVIQYHCLAQGVERPLPVPLPPVPPEPRSYVRSGRVIRLFTASEDQLIQNLRSQGKSNHQIAIATGRKAHTILGRFNSLARRAERNTTHGKA